MANVKIADRKYMASGIKSVRDAAVAGSFYPEDPVELKELLSGFFSKTKNITQGKELKALIVPHAGYIYSGLTAAWGFKQLPEIEDQHFVLIGPAHREYFTGLAADKNDFWMTPLGQVSQKISKHITRDISHDGNPHVSEHSLEVQLPFLQFLLKNNFTISTILTGDNSNYQKISDYLISDYPSAILIISSDMSHYLPKDKAEEVDRHTIRAIMEFDRNYLMTQGNVACGASGLIILLTIAENSGWKPKLIYYDTSATATGDKSQVVGYASIGFFL